MQEKNLTDLLSDASKNLFENKEIVKKKMETLSVKNIHDLTNKDVPDYLRLPSPDELIEMRQWAINYKKANKQASKREIRKATQKHFQIKVYR